MKISKDGIDGTKEIWYNDRTVDLSYIQANDVLEVTASKDQQDISVSMMTSKITGTVTTVSQDKIQIDDKTYFYEEGIVNKPSVGNMGKYYLDDRKRIVAFSDSDQESLATNYGYSKAKAKELGCGDVIVYTINTNTKKVESFAVLFQWSKVKNNQGNRWFEAGNDTLIPTENYAIANCHIIFGKVKSNRGNTVILNANGDSSNHLWDRVFPYSAMAVYLVDSARNTVVTADEADASTGDEVLIRDRLANMSLMVIH